MAVTVSTPSAVSNHASNAIQGNLRVAVRDVQFDSSYPTGGEPLVASDFGLSFIAYAIATIKTAGTGSVTGLWYDVANSKLKAYTAAAEVANTTDLSAVHAQVVVFGK